MAHPLAKKATIELHTKGADGCAISPNGTWVATGSQDKSICITDIATQEKVYTVECDNQVRGIAWSPDGTHLIAVTTSGSAIQVTNNDAHSTVYKIDKPLWGCAFSPSGILAVGGNDQEVTLLDPSNNYSVIEILSGFADKVRCLAFSPDGNLLAAGCYDGHMYIYGLTNGKWARVLTNMYHSKWVMSLCFSPSGRMLLVTSEDMTASIWNVPNGTTWPSTPHVTLKGHTNQVNRGAFLGDESHVITGSADKSLRIWSTSDGVQTVNHECKPAWSLSYHAASGIIATGTNTGQVGIWQTAAYDPCDVSAELPSHACVRTRLRIAQLQSNAAETTLSKVDNGLHLRMSRVQELKRSIADLEAKLTGEKKELAELQTDELRHFSNVTERHNALLGIINVCTQTLDSLTDCLKTYGLEDLRGDAFKEWLCDIGMSKLQTSLKDFDGSTLTMLNVGDVMDNDVTFNDAAALHLHGYIAHHKLSDDSAFAPPSETVLSWDEVQTANWIASLDDQYDCLVDAGWHGAALCSLSPPRVVEAGKGALKATEAAKFIGLVRAKRREIDGEKDEWVSKWSGANVIA